MSESVRKLKQSVDDIADFHTEHFLAQLWNVEGWLPPFDGWGGAWTQPTLGVLFQSDPSIADDYVSIALWRNNRSTRDDECPVVAILLGEDGPYATLLAANVIDFAARACHLGERVLYLHEDEEGEEEDEHVDERELTDCCTVAFREAVHQRLGPLPSLKDTHERLARVKAMLDKDARELQLCDPRDLAAWRSDR